MLRPVRSTRTTKPTNHRSLQPALFDSCLTVSDPQLAETLPSPNSSLSRIGYVTGIMRFFKSETESVMPSQHVLVRQFLEAWPRVGQKPSHPLGDQQCN